MPLRTKFTWQQTEDTVTVKIPMKNVRAEEIITTATNLYVKMTFCEYILELFLLHPIDTLMSVVNVSDDVIYLEMKKLESCMWSSLEMNLTKDEQKDARIENIKKFEEEVQNNLEKKRSVKDMVKKTGVREQIKIDTATREKLEKAKRNEMTRAVKELRLCEKPKKTGAAKVVKKVITKTQPIKTKGNKTQNSPPSRKKIPKDNDEMNKFSIVSKWVDEVANKNPIPIRAVCPAVRPTQVVTLNLTEREFRTPLRESRVEEETEWLDKQAKARQVITAKYPDLRPEERNPLYLKDKGDAFFKQKNYTAAINAYSTAVKMSPNFAALYVNRSAAYFCCCDYESTIKDCQTALQLLRPPCDANKKLRAKSFARQAASYYKLNMMKEAKVSMDEAMKLMPDNIAMIKLNDVVFNN